MKYLIGIWLLLFTMAFSLALIGWINFVGDIAWLPQKFRELNFFEVVGHPISLALLAFSMTYLNRRKQTKQIAAGIATGEGLAQRLYLTAIRITGKGGAKLLLHWRDTRTYSATELTETCGAISTAALIRDCDAAIIDPATVSPSLTTRQSLSGLYKLFAKHCASLFAATGITRKFVVVMACEDAAQIKITRIFEIPPAMLLLFYGDVEFHNYGTVRSVQAYRAIAMRILARQLISHKGQLPAWVNFQAGPVFAIRDLPHVMSEGEFPWWDARWDFDPSQRLTEEQIEQKRSALQEALGRLEGLPYAGSYTSVLDEPQFSKWQDELKRDIAQGRIPSAYWF